MPDPSEQYDRQPFEPLIIEPEIGRQLHFYENYQHGENYPLTATIAYASSTRLVNLQVIDRLGGSRGMTDVRLLQPNDDKLEPGAGDYAVWPPYIVDQVMGSRYMREKLAGAMTDKPSTEEIRDGLDQTSDEVMADTIDGEVVAGYQEGVSD